MTALVDQLFPFCDALSSPPFLAALPSLCLLTLRHPPAVTPAPSLHAFDPALGCWLHLPLFFLPFPSPSLVTASPSLLYIWADTSAAPLVVGDPKNPKSLVLCNPLVRSYHLLPPLGSALFHHDTVLAGPDGIALVLTKLAALAYASGADHWLKFSLNLPSKPRSPILMGDVIYTLCDMGTLLLCLALFGRIEGFCWAEQRLLCSIQCGQIKGYVQFCMIK